MTVSEENSKGTSGKQKPGEHLRPYWFKKGQSGNLSGRPKGRKTLPAILDEALHDEKTQEAYDLAKVLLDMAKTGDPKDQLAAIKEIMARVYGNVAKKQEVEIKGPTKLVELIDEATEDAES